MKKRTKILLALTMLVLITGFAAISFAGSNSGKNSPSEKPKEIMTPPEPGRSEYSLGDVDCNGKINSADARLALRMAVGLEILGAEQIAAADVDEDCKITAADARLILRAAVGLENFSEIDAIMREMSVREKVGQLFIVYPESLNFGSSKWEAVTDFTDAMSGALLNYPCGGVIMFGNNIVSPSQITRFNEKLLGASKIPLFICVDEEGGQVARLANNPAFGLPKYGSAAQVGAGGNPADAREMGSVIGGYLKKYGFNMDFAPVADVFTNPNNTVIGNRAFSSDAQSVASFASAFAEGLRQEGIIPVFKHFPGHGDTSEDSHTEVAVTYKTKEELKSCEWLPFKAAGNNDCIMAGHIAAPAVTGDMAPAVLSSVMINDILKEELGFGGLVITDSLSMKAVTNNYDSAHAALGAIKAGNDILLLPNDYTAAFDAVVQGVENGTISMDRLNASVRRILEIKRLHGILGAMPVN